MLGGSAILFILVLGSTASSARTHSGARGKLLDDLDATTQNLSVTLQSIGDALLATDAQGKVTMMNPVAVEMTGLERSRRERHGFGSDLPNCE